MYEKYIPDGYIGSTSRQYMYSTVVVVQTLLGAAIRMCEDRVLGEHASGVLGSLRFSLYSFKRAGDRNPLGPQRAFQAASSPGTIQDTSGTFFPVTHTLWLA